jgi:two-component system, cell cycle response regulator DivK
MTNHSSPLVLVVDDYEDNRTLYVAYLAASGFRVDDAADGVEAVAKARALLPDVIVMDLALPGIDGWEATRQLKGDPATKHIAILALSGHTLESHAVRAREVGCDAFLTKPYPPEKLVEKIKAVLAPR